MRSRPSEETILRILKARTAVLPVAEICRRPGINDATFYAWRSRDGSMEVAHPRRPKTLDEVTRELGKVLTEAMRHGATLRKALEKPSEAQRTQNSRELGPATRRAIRSVAPAG